jgi:plasmid stabilization system protein ParE
MMVRWRQRALDDAVEAAAYIAGDRPLAAASWREGLIEIVERLSVFPHSGRMVPEQGKPELREVIHADFRVIHLLRGEQIIVLAIRHARRRLKKRDLRGWIKEAEGEA